MKKLEVLYKIKNDLNFKIMKGYINVSDYDIYDKLKDRLSKLINKYNFISSKDSMFTSSKFLIIFFFVKYCLNSLTKLLSVMEFLFDPDFILFGDLDLI